MRMPSFTAYISKYFRGHPEIAIMNKANFYVRGTNVGEENEKVTPLPQLTGRSPASSGSFRHNYKKKAEKKMEASDSSRSP